MPKNGPFAYHLTVIAAAIRRHVEHSNREREYQKRNKEHEGVGACQRMALFLSFNRYRRSHSPACPVEHSNREREYQKRNKEQGGVGTCHRMALLHII